MKLQSLCVVVCALAFSATPCLRAMQESVFEPAHGVSVAQELAAELVASDPLALHKASSRGSIQSILPLIQAGAARNQVDTEGNNALHAAVAAEYPQIALMLITHGVSHSHRNHYGLTPLHAAILWHRERSMLDGRTLFDGRIMLDVLLDARADPNSGVDDRGYLPLQDAVTIADADSVDSLLKHKADPNAQDLAGNTALHSLLQNPPQYAAHKAWLLLKHGAKIDLKNRAGQTPYHCALTCVDHDAKYLVYASCVLTRRTCLQDFLDACCCGNASLVRACIALGANRAVQDEHGETPLHKAACCGHEDVVRVLLAHRVPLNVVSCGDGGETPLHCAVKNRQVRMARLLLQTGARANVCEGHLGSVMHLLVDYWNKDMFDVLCLHNADLNMAHPATAETPLHGAVKRRRYDIMSAFLEQKANPDLRDMCGRTPLYRAASLGDMKACQLLLAAGASVAIPSSKKVNPALAAKYAKHKDLASYLSFCLKVQRTVFHDPLALIGVCKQNQTSPDSKDRVRRLARTYIQADARVNVFDKNCMTPLHWAACWGNVGLVQLLLDHGADRDAQSSGEQTPLDCARSRRYTSVVTLLASGDAD